jgi:hypothetical protein
LMTMQHFIGFWPQIAEVFCILGVTAMALWSISVESSGWKISTDGWKPMFWDVYHLSTGAGFFYNHPPYHKEFWGTLCFRQTQKVPLKEVAVET